MNAFFPTTDETRLKMDDESPKSMLFHAAERILTTDETRLKMALQ
jgi:hypothetical protein